MGTSSRVLNSIRLIFLNRNRIFGLLALLFFSWYVLIRPEYNVSKLKNDGIETKGWIYRKSSVGSKGTIRSFYTFEVGGKTYEGFYDNPGLKQWDSISIIYYRNDPSLNQAKQFVDEYR